jgi:hypothetical protein
MAFLQHPNQMFFADMGVPLGCSDRGMPKEFLYYTNYQGGFLLHYLDALVYPNVPPGRGRGRRGGG